MKKSEFTYDSFVRLVAKESGVKKADIRATINAIAKVLPQILVEHDSMNIRNIGTFELKRKPMSPAVKENLVNNSILEGLTMENFPEEMLTVFFKKSKFAKDSLNYYNTNRSEIDLSLPTRSTKDAE